MSRISTHVLDTAKGKPAAGVPARLERQDSSGKWAPVGAAETDQDGRCAQLLPEGATLVERLANLFRHPTSSQRLSFHSIGRMHDRESQRCVTAVARELIASMWAIAKAVPLQA